MREAVAELAAQFHRADASAASFDVGAERELIDMASPILDPAQVRAGLSAIDDCHFGDQHRIVTEGCDNRLVDRVAVARDFLAKVSHAENTIEAPCVARIESAQGFRPIGEVADAAAELASFGRILVEK